MYQINSFALKGITAMAKIQRVSVLAFLVTLIAHKALCDKGDRNEGEQSIGTELFLRDDGDQNEGE